VLNTLKLSKDLAAASIPQRQAEAIATAIATAVAGGAPSTKLAPKEGLTVAIQGLKNELRKFKNEIIVWLIGSVLIGDLAIIFSLWLHR
jgi:hypothetical protein